MNKNNQPFNVLERQTFRRATEHIIRVFNGIRLNKDGSFENTPEYLSRDRQRADMAEHGDDEFDRYEVLDALADQREIRITERFAGDAGALLYDSSAGYAVPARKGNFAALAAELMRRRRIATVQLLDLTTESRADSTAWTGDLLLMAELEPAASNDVQALHTQLLAAYEETLLLVDQLWEHVVVVAENLHDEVEYIIPPALIDNVYNGRFVSIRTSRDNE